MLIVSLIWALGADLRVLVRTLVRPTNERVHTRELIHLRILMSYMQT